MTPETAFIEALESEDGIALSTRRILVCCGC